MRQVYVTKADDPSPYVVSPQYNGKDHGVYHGVVRVIANNEAHTKEFCDPNCVREIRCECGYFVKGHGQVVELFRKHIMDNSWMEWRLHFTLYAYYHRRMGAMVFVCSCGYNANKSKYQAHLDCSETTPGTRVFVNTVSSSGSSSPEAKYLRQCRKSLQLRMQTLGPLEGVPFIEVINPYTHSSQSIVWAEAASNTPGTTNQGDRENMYTTLVQRTIKGYRGQVVLQHDTETVIWESDVVPDETTRTVGGIVIRARDLAHNLAKDKIKLMIESLVEDSDEPDLPDNDRPQDA